MPNISAPYEKGEKQFCHNCGKEMEVDIVAKYVDSNRYETEDGTIFVEGTHCIVKCKECNKITHCIYSENSEELDIIADEEGNPTPVPYIHRIGYYPCAKFPDLRMQIVNSYCPEDIKRLLSEGYIAFQNELYTLASTSLRMVVDAICQDAEARNLIPSALREELLNKGFISKNSYDVIDNIVNNANQAAHRFVSLSASELRSAFIILSILIAEIYVIPAKSEAIRQAPNSRR